MLSTNSFIKGRRVRNWSWLWTATFLIVISIHSMSQNTAKVTDRPSSAFPATEVNSKLPEWIRFTGEYRLRPEDHTAYKFTSGADDAFLLSRLRLNLSGHPTPWFGFLVQAQDSHAMGIDSSHVTSSINDTFDLRQAYIQLSPKPWLRMTAGRQELRFGGERLVGVSDWTNAPRVFDAIRLTVGTERNHFDVFTSSVVVNDPIHFDNHAGGLTFHGIYGSFSHLVPKATVEPYVLWKALPVVKSEEGTAGDSSIFTPGLRWKGTLPAGFDYLAEGAAQRGHFSNDDVSAWAAYGLIGYTVALPMQPRISSQYDYSSGDRQLKDGKIGTFDQLYPSNHGVFGLVDLLGWRNVRQLRGGIDFKPLSRLAVFADYRNIHLVSREDGLYGSTGSIIVKAPKGGALSSYVGQETDLSCKYQVRKNIDTGAGYGHLFAGSFLIQNSPGASASIAYSFVTYKF